MPTKQMQEPTEDALYLAKITMDEVGADIEVHGHVPVTPDNRTQDPFTPNGALATALDELVDFSNPNKDTTEESHGELGGNEETPTVALTASSQDLPPNDATMDSLPKHYPFKNPIADELAGELEAVSEDASPEVPSDSDEEVHQKWIDSTNEKNVPKFPERDEDDDRPDENGLVYLTYIVSVDPKEYISPNYRPTNNGIDIKDAAAMKKGIAKKTPKKEGNEDKSNGDADESFSEEDVFVVQEEDEPSPKEEEQAAEEADALEEKSKDAADESVAPDFATALDGSSFICFDEVHEVDYSKIAMDTTPRHSATRQTCQTTFAQCRAENPLYCRFHGPKLLELDLKTMIRNRLQRQGIREDGLVVSVEKDSNRMSPSGNALRFKVTVGCTPQQKNQVRGVLDAMFNREYRTPNSVSGISLVSNPRARGSGDTRQMEAELEMDLLSADRPPRRGAEERASELNEQLGGSDVNEPPTEEPPNEDAPTPEADIPADAPESPSGNTPPNEPPPQEQSIPQEQRETPPSSPEEGNAQSTANNGIEHLEGGVKARFSDAEIAAIEREKNRAMRESNASPDNAELASYAHTLSSMLGSSQSAYGRRHGALNGIRDGITKAELLAKAEQRLERVVDAENIARYDGACRAMQKIAEISGLGPLEFDGTHISLANGNPSAQPTENLSSYSQEDLNRIFSDSQPPVAPPDAMPAQSPQSADASQPEPDRAPTEEEIREAAELIAPHTGYPTDAVLSALQERIAGTHSIGASEQAAIGLLPEGHAVRRALERRLAEQSTNANNVSRTRTRRTQSASASTTPTPTPSPSVNTDVATTAMIKPTDDSYVPNPSMSRDEILRIREDNARFWQDGRMRTLIDAPRGRTMRSINARSRLAKELFKCQQVPEVQTADKALVAEQMPNLPSVAQSNIGVHLNEMNPFTSNPYCSCNCYKGAIAAVLRMRGFWVNGISRYTPSRIYRDSENPLLKKGDNQETYKKTMQAYSEQYERITGSFAAQEEALSLMAHGDPERGIAPYPDGTIALSMNEHCRVNYLYKGQWFRADPYGYDISSTMYDRNEDAPFILNVTPGDIAAKSTSVTNSALRGNLNTIISNLYRYRDAIGNARWNYDPTSSERQMLVMFISAAHALHLNHISLSGRGAGGRPSEEDINKVADYLTKSGKSPMSIYKPITVIRPQDRLCKEMVGLTEPASA